MPRVKISAPYREVIQQIDSFIRIDKNNQQRFGSTSTKKPEHNFSTQQFLLLTEALFISAYTQFEAFLEDVFLLYTLEKPTISNIRPKSYLSPRDFDHAFDLIKSSMPHLDWTDPDTVIKRAETYLKDGGPIKNVLAGNRVLLNNMKRIRNHIAHNSRESLKQYKSVLLDHYKIVPLKIPRPGEFLLNMVPQSNPRIHYLLHYLQNIKRIATEITR